MLRFLNITPSEITVRNHRPKLSSEFSDISTKITVRIHRGVRIHHTPSEITVRFHRTPSEITVQDQRLALEITGPK